MLRYINILKESGRKHLECCVGPLGPSDNGQFSLNSIRNIKIGIQV